MNGDSVVVTSSPSVLRDLVLNVTNSSATVGSVCSWTVSLKLCLGTVIPIALMFLVMAVLLVISCRITQQSEALDELVHVSESCLVPFSLKDLDAVSLSAVMQCVMDLPLKTLLPRIDLGYLVEPCATMGVASVRDMLRLNSLALRDVGMGPKEQRMFTRALERRIRLRSKLQEAVADVTGRPAGLKQTLDKAARLRKQKQPQKDLKSQTVGNGSF